VLLPLVPLRQLIWAWPHHVPGRGGGVSLSTCLPECRHITHVVQRVVLATPPAVNRLREAKNSPIRQMSVADPHGRTAAVDLVLLIVATGIPYREVVSDLQFSTGFPAAVNPVPLLGDLLLLSNLNPI
jgi:hypothetical protein